MNKIGRASSPSAPSVVAAPTKEPGPAREFSKTAADEIMARVDLLQRKQLDQAAESAKTELQAAKRALDGAKREDVTSQSDAVAAAVAETEATRAHAAAERVWRKAAEQEAAVRRTADEAEQAKAREEKLAANDTWLEESGLAKVFAERTRPDWREKLAAARDRVTEAKAEVAAAAAHAAAQLNACAREESRKRACAAASATAQVRVETAKHELTQATKRLAAKSKRAKAAEQAVAQAAAQQRPSCDPRAKPTATVGAAGSSSSSIDASVASLVKAAAVGTDCRDAEAKALVERRERRRAEIYALNMLLMKALTGRNDP